MRSGDIYVVGRRKKYVSSVHVDVEGNLVDVWLVVYSAGEACSVAFVEMTCRFWSVGSRPSARRGGSLRYAGTALEYTTRSGRRAGWSRA